MGFFPNWAGVLLDSAGFGHDTDNMAFMNDWHTHASSDCLNNPVDISRAAGGSDGCKVLTTTRTAQKYDRPEDAATAFDGQINSGNFSHLHAVLASGAPPTLSNYADVSADLRKWGSQKYAGYIVQKYGPPPDGIAAPRLHSGWGSLRVSFNREMPGALKQSKKNTDAALRALGKVRKVRG